RPGKTTSQGAVRTYSAAADDSMRPQDGWGSGTPNPRNDSAASINITKPTWAVAITIRGASVFGSTWLIAMRVSLMPMALAASTKGCSRNDRVLARTTRAGPGISATEIAMIVLRSDGPSAAATSSAMTYNGKACRTSMNRCTI